MRIFMKIQGNYQSYAGKGYEPEHHHHITKCLHEEKQSRQSGATAGVRQDAQAVSDAGKSGGQEQVYGDYGEKKEHSGRKRGIGLGAVKDFWDSLGVEDSLGTEDKRGSQETHSTGMGLRAAGIFTSAVKQAFSEHLVNRWESVREKIRVAAGNALKRFGRGRDAFGALTDPGTHFSRQGRSRHPFRDKTKKDARQETDAVLSAALPNSHLMDSYSKTGAYCRLNENLTYQKGSSGGNRQDQTAVSPTHYQQE